MITEIILGFLLVLAVLYVLYKRRQLMRQVEQELMEFINDKENMHKIRNSLNEALLSAQNKPFRVERCVVILSPKPKMFDWINGFSEGMKYHRSLTLEDNGNDYKRAYLISCDDPRKIMKKVNSMKDYFMSEVTNGYSPKNYWAWEPKDEEFDEWFEVTIVGELWDLETNQIIKEPDELSAIGSINL